MVFHVKNKDFKKLPKIIFRQKLDFQNSVFHMEFCKSLKSHDFVLKMSCNFDVLFLQYVCMYNSIKGRSSDAFLIVNATSKMQLIISQCQMNIHFTSCCCSKTQGCDLTFFSHQALLLNHEFSLPINNNIESRANESAKFHI